MKKLRQFQKFDHEKFFAGKMMVVKEVKETFEYDESGENTGKVLGTTVVAVITKDNTKYDDEEKRNLNFMESFNIKVPKINFEVAQGAEIKPVNITKASVYGKYMNQLSIECEDIKVANHEQS